MRVSHCPQAKICTAETDICHGTSDQSFGYNSLTMNFDPVELLMNRFVGTIDLRCTFNFAVSCPAVVLFFCIKSLLDSFLMR